MPVGLSLSRFDAVLFDVDGTLVDSMEMIVRGLGDTYERYAGLRPGRDEILSEIGMPLTAQVRRYIEDEPSPEAVAEMTTFAISRFEAHEEHESVFPAAVQALRLCHRQGMHTALVTSKSAIELSGFLRRFEGAPFVQATVCATDVQNPKPHPESALRACRLLQVDPSRAVMIGDSVYDIRCAKQAGVTAVAVSYGSGRREALLAEEPALMLDAPEDLLAWTESAFLQTPCHERS